ncbi:hypothetical protein IIC65_04250 [Candidatus Sumerlaeota bacterium]|nr:hypothetical protein [Candidatus Sumerlaeota bacterium]
MNQSSLNRLLTLLTIAVLIVAIAILFWLRGNTTSGLEEIVNITVASFNPPSGIFGNPDDPAVNFSAAEALVARARLHPYIRDLIVTKRLSQPPTPLTGSPRPPPSSVQDSGGAETPIVPYNLLAISKGEGWDWRDRLDGLRKIPIGTSRPYGFLYFDLDRSMIRSMNGAIATASVALAASLFIFIGRLYFQQSSLQRLGVELQQRRRELIRLERLALAGQLSASLLHDLRKPVLHVRHSLEDLKEALGDFAGATAALVETEEQVDLFFQMLNDTQLERFVRSDRVQEEYLGINETLDAALRLVHYERRSVDISRDYAEDLPPLMGQPFRLIQLFSNLILNAYQAMGNTGLLALQTRALDAKIEVLVTDNGPGIAPESLASVFDPFFTTKSDAEGTGLGLAISRLIVEELNGTLDVDSSLGGPTTFRVSFPCEPRS